MALLDVLKARLDCRHWAGFRHAESLLSAGERADDPPAAPTHPGASEICSEPCWHFQAGRRAGL